MDLIPHCSDGSDENPQYHLGWNCEDEYFKCPDDHHCISATRVCDGDRLFSVNDFSRCFDGSDEANCEDWQCVQSFWKCADNKQCISAGGVCDGRPNCYSEGGVVHY